MLPIKVNPICYAVQDGVIIYIYEHEAVGCGMVMRAGFSREFNEDYHLDYIKGAAEIQFSSALDMYRMINKRDIEI